MPSRSVRFKEIGPSSLDVEVTAWFEATWAEFTLIRQEVLLQLLEAIEAAGVSLAYPTQTVRVESSRPSAPAVGPRGRALRSSHYRSASERQWRFDGSLNGSFARTLARLANDPS